MPGIQWQHLIDVFCVVGLLASSSLNGDRKTSAVLGCYVICDQLAGSDVRTGGLAVVLMYKKRMPATSSLQCDNSSGPTVALYRQCSVPRSCRSKVLCSISTSRSVSHI